MKATGQRLDVIPAPQTTKAARLLKDYALNHAFQRADLAGFAMVTVNAEGYEAGAFFVGKECNFNPAIFPDMMKQCVHDLMYDITGDDPHDPAS